MALKDTWKDLVDDESEIVVEPINDIANAVIKVEDDLGNIDTALDKIIKIQNSLINGESA